MKLPIWYQDRYKKWQLVPAGLLEILEKFEDGRQGISFYRADELSFLGNQEFYDLLRADYLNQRYTLKDET